MSHIQIRPSQTLLCCSLKPTKIRRQLPTPPGPQPEAVTESKPDPESLVRPTEDQSKQQHALACPGLRTSPFQEPSRLKKLDLASLVRVAKFLPSHFIDVVSLGSGVRISAPSAHRQHSHEERPQKCMEAVVRQTTGLTGPLGCVPQTPHNTPPQQTLTGGENPP